MDANSDMESPGVHPKAYRFFPTKQEQKLGYNKKDGKRIIYYGQIEHDDFEKKKLAQFKEYYVKKNGKNFESDYFNDQRLILFLSSYRYDNEATVKAMNEHLDFKKKYIENSDRIKVIQYDKDQQVKLLVDKGFFYITGRDKSFRPIIVFDMKQINMKDNDANLRAIVFVQEVVIDHMFIPGQVQCWNIIYDLAGFGITDVPVGDLKSNLQIISANYGGRLYKLFMLNAPGTVYFSWKVVKNFLDPITVEKITIAKKNTDDSMWNEIDKSQIQKKFGGTQQNRKQFYPFKVPQAVYNKDRLISDEKYQDMYKQGTLKQNQICPVLSKKLDEKNKKVEEPPKVQEPVKVQAKVEQKTEISVVVEEKKIEIKEQKPEVVKAEVLKEQVREEKKEKQGAEIVEIEVKQNTKNQIEN